MNPKLDYLRLATWQMESYLPTIASLMRRHPTRKAAWLQYRGRRSEDGQLFFGMGEQTRKRHHIIQFSGGLADDECAEALRLDNTFYCTRLDIQVTIKEPPEHDAIKLYAGLHRKGKSIVRSPGAATVYIGVRTSELFTRIYEKPMENARYLRCEFELKGRYARAAFGKMRDGLTTKAELFQQCLNQARVPEPHAKWFTTQADQIGGLTAAESLKSLENTAAWLRNTETGILRHLGHDDTRGMVMDFISRLEVAKSFAELD